MEFKASQSATSLNTCGDWYPRHATCKTFCLQHYMTVKFCGFKSSKKVEMNLVTVRFSGYRTWSALDAAYLQQGHDFASVCKHRTCLTFYKLCIAFHNNEIYHEINPYH